jgi:hypothetical protein
MVKDVSEIRYEELIQLQIKNGVGYSEHVKGSRKTLYVFGKPVCSVLVGGSYLDIGSLSDAQFNSFIGVFKKTLYNTLIKNPDLMTNEIKFSGTARGKNKQLFNSLPVDSYYWNIDLSSAYWQMGYRLGYISDKFYNKYITKDEYKVVKRLCFSFLARTNYRRCFVDGKETIFWCDNTVDKRVYDNVRNELYKIILGALDIAGDQYIDYNIDGISVTKYAHHKIINYFKENNLEFKMNPVFKVSENQYTLKDKTRKF